ncbi:MAG: GntR family transcriptional regulator [Rubrivivax sp.]
MLSLPVSPASAAAPTATSAPGQARWGVLAQQLRERIRSGAWRPGTPLPAETALAAEHGVALGTVRQALARLADEGLVERQHGKGTFVRGALGGAPMLRFFRFAGGESGAGATAPRSRILSRRERVPPMAVSQALGLERGTTVLHLTRLRLIDERPRLLEDIWLTLPAFAPLLQESPSTWGDLLYPHYATACGVTVHRAVDEIRFGTLEPAQARRLELPDGHPAAIVQRVALDIADRPVECRWTRGDAHAFCYSVAIS